MPLNQASCSIEYLSILSTFAKKKDLSGNVARLDDILRGLPACIRRLGTEVGQDTYLPG
jgi:hypothetical protein